MKIRPLTAKVLFRKDGHGQIGVTEILVAFHHFANAPKNRKVQPTYKTPCMVDI
jgi:hypothetical protein